jgi:hypothetical protein
MFLVHFVEIIQAHIEDFPKKHARDEGIMLGIVVIMGCYGTCCTGSVVAIVV